MRIVFHALSCLGLCSNSHSLSLFSSSLAIPTPFYAQSLDCLLLSILTPEIKHALEDVSIDDEAHWLLGDYGREARTWGHFDVLLPHILLVMLYASSKKDRQHGEEEW